MYVCLSNSYVIELTEKKNKKFFIGFLFIVSLSTRLDLAA